MPNPEFDLRTMTLLYTIEDDEGLEDIVEVPAQFVICSTCRGKGQHSLAVDGHGITASEWHHDWSFEEKQAYMAGDYDRRCDDCDGSGKYPEPDWVKLSPKDTERVRSWMKDQREFEAMVAAERRMGA